MEKRLSQIQILTKAEEILKTSGIKNKYDWCVRVSIEIKRYQGNEKLFRNYQIQAYSVNVITAESDMPLAALENFKNKIEDRIKSSKL